MTDIRERLEIKYPVFQGGMANIADGRFAAAVSNAGGLGIIAGGGMDPAGLEENIRLCRSLTGKPFGVNIMLMHPAGNPAKFMARWKEAGCMVFPVVPSAALARRMEKVGADGVIAEGTESGGHVGELTTMALVPQVADSVTIPVIAAGGIACARQLRAAFALGAVGVQVGTCLLVAEECPIHQNYKEAILRAKDTDTVVTGRIGGTPVRVLKNRMAREYVKREKAGADKMELETFTLGGLRRAVLEGDTENGSLMAGQVAGMCGAIRPVAEILAELAGGVPPLSCHAAGDHPKGA